MATVAITALGAADLHIANPYPAGAPRSVGERVRAVRESLALGEVPGAFAGRVAAGLDQLNPPPDSLVLIATASGDDGDTQPLARLIEQSPGLLGPAGEDVGVQIEVLLGSPVDYRNVLPRVADILSGLSPEDDHLLLHGGGTPQLALALLLLAPVTLGRPSTPVTIVPLTEGDSPLATLVSMSSTLSGSAARWAQDAAVQEALSVAVKARDAELVRTLLAAAGADPSATALADIASRLQNRAVRTANNRIAGGEDVPDLPTHLQTVIDLTNRRGVLDILEPLAAETQDGPYPAPHNEGEPCWLAPATLRKLAAREALAAVRANPPRLVSLALHTTLIAESTPNELKPPFDGNNPRAVALRRIRTLRNRLVHDNAEGEPANLFQQATQAVYAAYPGVEDPWTAFITWILRRAEGHDVDGPGRDTVRVLLDAALRVAHIPEPAQQPHERTVVVAFASPRDPELTLSLGNIRGQIDALVVLGVQQPMLVDPARRQADTGALARAAAGDLGGQFVDTHAAVSPYALNDPATVKWCATVVDQRCRDAARIIIVDGVGPKGLRHPVILAALDLAARTGATIEIIANFEYDEPQVLDLTRLLAVVCDHAQERLILHELRAAGRLDLEAEHLLHRADGDAPAPLLDLARRLQMGEDVDPDDAVEEPVRVALRSRHDLRPRQRRIADAAFALDRAARGTGVVPACELAAAVTRLREYEPGQWPPAFDQRNRLAHQLPYYVDTVWDPRPRARLLESVRTFLGCDQDHPPGACWAGRLGVQVGPDPLAIVLDGARTDILPALRDRVEAALDARAP